MNYLPALKSPSWPEIIVIRVNFNAFNFGYLFVFETRRSESIKRSSLNFHFTIYSQYFTNNPHKCEILGIKQMRGGSWNFVHHKMWHSTMWWICSIYFQQSHEFIIKHRSIAHEYSFNSFYPRVSADSFTKLNLKM